jgi:DNA-binding transcriptional regulator YiaG
MKKKYQSEILHMVYDEAAANFKVGAINEERMRYYENACLVPETSVVQTAKSVGASPIPMKPSRVYASKAD